MTAVTKRTRQETGAEDSMRRCLATGTMMPRAEMVRFVIAPDGIVVPDLAENLPGRGLWVAATAETIGIAAQKNLFAKAARRPAYPALTLIDDVIRLLRKRCLDLLGLAKSAGIAILGEAQTEAALRARKLALYMHAPDATRILDNRLSVAECDMLSRHEMGSALGYEQIVYAGLGPHGLTDKLWGELSRLRMMIKTEN